MQLLHFGFVQHLLLNIVCLLYFDLCHISVYAFRAPRQMSFGSLGSPSENEDVIIVHYQEPLK